MCDTSPDEKHINHFEMSVPQYHQLDKAFSLDKIRDRLNDGSFWSHYSVEYSPGDGHCFMHSVKSSLKSQLSIDVSIKKLSMLITKETMSNHIDYTPSIQENTVANLRKGLYDYIERKIYKSWYGDIVPTITANSFYINLIVIEKHEYGFRCYCVGKNASNPSCLPLLVFKCGEHYDGLVLSHDREYRCPGIDHVMRVTACNDYNAAVCSLHDVIDHLNSIDMPAGGRSQQLTFETKIVLD